MTDPRLDLINRVLAELPVPLVGSVAYDGQKHTRRCTQKAFDAFVECYSLVRPRHMLEIGTHAGGSALMALALTDATVLSVDIGHTWITANHSFAEWGAPAEDGGLSQVNEVLQRHFPGRFDLIIGDSTGMSTRDVIRQCHAVAALDCAFIDGNHAYDYVKSDIQFARSLGIKDILLDDLNSADGSDTVRAAKEEGLTIVWESPRIHSGGVSFGLTRASN
jgi:hypothetical protein